MDYNNIAIGLDLEEISRFEKMTEDTPLVKRVFTEKEIEYSFSHKNFAQHLCARFCAKEAVIKALSDFEINNVTFSDIEIVNEDSGKPVLTITTYPEIKSKISVSHTKTTAAASVILFK